jgi:hypothetical protein
MFGREMAKSQILLWDAWRITKLYQIPMPWDVFRSQYMELRRMFEIVERTKTLAPYEKIPKDWWAKAPFRMKTPYESVVRITGKEKETLAPMEMERTIKSYRPQSYQDILKASDRFATKYGMIIDTIEIEELYYR